MTLLLDNCSLFPPSWEENLLVEHLEDSSLKQAAAACSGSHMSHHSNWL